MDKIKFPLEIEKSSTLKKPFEKGFNQSKEENSNEIESVNKENSQLEERSVLSLISNQVITTFLLLCLLIPFLLFLYIYKEETKNKIHNLRNKF
jgi:predicted PurR-regulated permease PerM